MAGLTQLFKWQCHPSFCVLENIYFSSKRRIKKSTSQNTGIRTGRAPLDLQQFFLASKNQKTGEGSCKWFSKISGCVSCNTYPYIRMYIYVEEHEHACLRIGEEGQQLIPVRKSRERLREREKERKRKLKEDGKHSWSSHTLQRYSHMPSN